MMTTEEMIARLQNLDRKGGLGYEAHDLLKLVVTRLEAFSGDPSHEMMAAGHAQMAYIDCTPRAVWNAMRSVAIGEPQNQAAQA